MSSFLDKVKELRSDLSEWLIHFTQGTNAQGRSTLGKILTESALRSKENPPYICFSEAPLSELNKLFQLFSKYPTPRFAPFGVAVRKEWLFHKGGRSVIYGPAEECNDLPPGMRFRHVDYTPAYDFTWQREWLIGVDHLKLEPSETLVLVPSEDEAFGLACDIEVDYEYEGPDEVSIHGGFVREWYSLGLDQVAKKEIHPDVLFAKLMTEQELNPPQSQ